MSVHVEGAGPVVVITIDRPEVRNATGEAVAGAQRFAAGAGRHGTPAT